MNLATLVGKAGNLTRSILPGLGNKVAIMVMSEDAIASDCWEAIWNTCLFDRGCQTCLIEVYLFSFVDSGKDSIHAIVSY